MMKTKKIIIYRLICLITNMSYIGKTNNFSGRIKKHIIADSLIGKAIRKHELDNFKIEFLWEAINEKEANIVEKVAICAYKTQIPNGYNITPGGDGGAAFIGKHHSEKTIEKMKKVKQGKHHTVETIEKMRQAKQGKHPSKETIEKMQQAALGNKNGKGNQGYKHSKETIEKIRKGMQGKKNAQGHKQSKGAVEKRTGDKNGSYKHGKYTKEAEIERLKARIKKLEEKI